MSPILGGSNFRRHETSKRLKLWVPWNGTPPLAVAVSWCRLPPAFSFVPIWWEYGADATKDGIYFYGTLPARHNHSRITFTPLK